MSELGMPDSEGIDAQAEFTARWHAFCDTVGPKLVMAMSQEAPRDTGQLADDTQGWRDEDEHLYIESTDDRGPIAKYMILGTQPHPIEPVNARALHFYGAGGEEVFAMHVEHPGTEANPFNERAWESVRDEVVADFNEIVGHGMLAAWLNPWRKEI